MRTIVTGGAGFIGSHLVDELTERGHEVIVVDNLHTGHRRNLHDHARLCEVDIRDGNDLHKVFERHQPQVVFHLAAQTSVAVSTRHPAFDADININGTLRVLEACVRHGVERLVFSSTGGAIYGEVPLGESAQVGSPLRPTSPYGCSKLAGEAYIACWAELHGLKYNILRYANVYGPRQDPHGEAGVVAIFITRILNGEDIQINACGEQGDLGCVRDYVYASDVVAANLLASQDDRYPHIANVGSGEPTSTAGIALMVGRALGVDIYPDRVKDAPHRVGDLKRSVLCPTNVSSVELADGIEATVEWFRAQKTMDSP